MNKFAEYANLFEKHLKDYQPWRCCWFCPCECNWDGQSLLNVTQVTLRDYPHLRPDCGVHAFEEGSTVSTNALFCERVRFIQSICWTAIVFNLYLICEQSITLHPNTPCGVKCDFPIQSEYIVWLLPTASWIEHTWQADTSGKLTSDKLDTLALLRTIYRCSIVVAVNWILILASCFGCDSLSSLLAPHEMNFVLCCTL